MAYREDRDLEFFAKLDSTDLDDLVYLLIYDHKDNEKRLAETLTINENYKRYSPDHIRYWRDIAAELQCFGGNTFANCLRGGCGVLYKEILLDVCDKMKVSCSKYEETQAIEDKLLMSVLGQLWEKMSPEERRGLLASIKGDNPLDAGVVSLAAFQAIFRMGGFKSYQLTLIIVNSIWKVMFGTGLRLATNATVARVLGVLTGPVGMVITALWTLVDIGGAAYRVTIPAVLMVAMLRKKYLYAAQEQLLLEL